MSGRRFFISVSIIIIVILFLIGVFSVIVRVGRLSIAIKRFEGTQGYELAKAVMWQNVSKIKKICKEKPSVMYIEDDKDHYTLLHWALLNKRMRSTKALLKVGMNPNVQTSVGGKNPFFVVGGKTPLFVVAENHKIGVKYMKLLLDYGADPDIGLIPAPDRVLGDGSVISSPFIKGTTPLMVLPTMYIPAQKVNMAKAKLLIEQGKADINKKNDNHQTAAIKAVLANDFAMAYYLIVELKANITDVYYSKPDIGERKEDKPHYLVEILRLWWILKLDSEEYKIKLKIIEELKRQGVDYWAEPIHDYALQNIKKLYPDSWEEYIKSY